MRGISHKLDFNTLYISLFYLSNTLIANAKTITFIIKLEMKNVIGYLLNKLLIANKSLAFSPYNLHILYDLAVL